MIKVSIIMPVFNMDKYIENAINSVLKQSIKELEIICIDDGSTDNSANIVKKCIKQDERVKLVQVENQGAGKARNLGMEMAQGEYIFFLDADDWLYDEHALETLYQASKRKDVDICGGKLVRYIGDTYIEIKEYDIYGNDIFTKEEVLDFGDYQCFYYFWRYLYKRELLIDNGLIFPDYKSYEDPVFLLKVMAQGRKFATVGRNIYCYRSAYKRINWSEEKVTDLFYGVRDSLCISQKMGWEHAYIVDLRKWCESYITFAVRAKSYGVLKIAEEIIHKADVKILENNNIKWQEICPDLNRIKRDIDCLTQYERQLLEKLKSADSVILYGAGTIGKRMLDYLKKHSSINVIGFAVSDGQNSDMYIDGVKVYPISQLLKYSYSAEVVLTVGYKLQQEIEANVKRLGFENVMLLQQDFQKYIL